MDYMNKFFSENNYDENQHCCGNCKYAAEVDRGHILCCKSFDRTGKNPYDTTWEEKRKHTVLYQGVCDLHEVTGYEIDIED